jgi:beta-xylosidase
MKVLLLWAASGLFITSSAAASATNPILFADIPDMSMIRVGNTYYMSSTTMHLSPGLPIMKSTDLVNWKLVNYAYDVLEEDVDALNLANSKNAYGRGTWASSLRFHNGLFYATPSHKQPEKPIFFLPRILKKAPGSVNLSHPLTMITPYFLMKMGGYI